MPISSGFGGYTGTTRRKPQPKRPEKVISVSPRRQVKVQPLYRVNSDDDMMGNHKTIYVDEEPEEEVVHVVHRPKPKPKQKIIYVDEEPEPEPKIVYVNRKPETQYVVQQHPPQQQIIMAQPQPQQQQQLVYAQPQQAVYQYPSTSSQPQYVYYDQNQGQNLQYVVQQPSDFGNQAVYLDQGMSASNMVYLNDGNQYSTVMPSNNMIMPANNIVYR